MSIPFKKNNSNNDNDDEPNHQHQQQERLPRLEWEIDPSKLIIKAVIPRRTFSTTVHRGIYDGLDVTVKLLDWGEEGHRTEAEIASLRADFTQEVAVWHKLDHPNVTKFIGATMGTPELNIQTDNGHIGMPPNVRCVVVEYLPGGALKSFLIRNRRTKLAFKVVVQLALDLARGLSYLHCKKIVHRDVKTENMLLDKTHTLKIADFTVARDEAPNPNDMTGETGTLGYMAPEVSGYRITTSCLFLKAELLGKYYEGAESTYLMGYSTGTHIIGNVTCTVLASACGQYIAVTHRILTSASTSAVIHQNLRPKIPRRCPNSLAAVMKLCWDANPDKRPEMDEVASMLEAMILVDQPQSCSCFRRY